MMRSKANKIIKEYRLILMALITLSALVSHAQSTDTLRISDAIKIGLENNFSLRIARNDQQVARNNNTLGAAGFLPKVDINSSVSGTNYNIRQELATGQVNETNSYPSTTLYGGIQLSWTLFDGFAIFANRQRLGTFEEINSIAYQLRVEDVVSDIIVNYYTLSVEKQLLDIYKEIMRLSADRLNIAREKAAIGTSYQLAVMQAEVDYRTDSAQVLKQINRVKDLTITLNKLLGRNPTIQFEIERKIPEVKLFEQDSVIEILKNQNKELLISRLNLRLKEIAIKEAQASRYPRLTLSSAYNISQTNTPDGSTTLGRSIGPSYGITLGIPLFNGFNVSRNIANARIYMENQQFNLQAMENDLTAEAVRLTNSLMLANNLVEIEKKSASLAKQNADISIEKYRVGLISDLELRDAQIRYLNAEFRYQNALIQAKSAEVAIQVLMGNLQMP
ncbi:MAG: TolC family protein [Bacteroidota bacterium]